MLNEVNAKQLLVRLVSSTVEAVGGAKLAREGLGAAGKWGSVR